jgi:carbon storage regulator
MLVLARSENEKIRIGDDIEITVVSIRSNCVRLGVTAPKSVRVDRQEVYERKNAEESQKARHPGKHGTWPT